MRTPKTKNPYRQVDVCPSLAYLPKQLVAERSGLLFIHSSGKSPLQTNILRRSLQPILNDLGVPKAGFHAMRRFRTTWLRKQQAPEDLIRFWLGHANESITDGYSKLDKDAEFRREVAEKVGMGFDVPESMRPMRPKIRKKVLEAVAA